MPHGIKIMVAKTTKAIIEKQIKKTFSPEFINRIDDIITFNSLTKENIGRIIDNELAKLYQRLDRIGVKVELGDALKGMIVDRGYSAEYGARPLKRTIQKHIEDVLTDELLQGDVPEKTVLSLDWDKEADRVVVKRKKPRTKKQ